MSHRSPGQIQPLTRSIDVVPDPHLLYRTLRATGGGVERETALFESADAASGGSNRSILITQFALFAECRGQRVEVRTFSVGGRGPLAFLKGKLEAFVDEDESEDRVVFVFKREVDRNADDRERLSSASPLDVLRVLSTGLSSTVPLAKRTPMLVGTFAHDVLDVFEPLPDAKEDRVGYPDYRFGLVEESLTISPATGTTLISTFHHGGDDETAVKAREGDLAHRIGALADAVRACPIRKKKDNVSSISSAEKLDVECDVDDDKYEGMVRKAQEHILAGDVFQIVPSRSFRVACKDPLRAYEELRALNPSPYMFLMESKDGLLFGASPETSVEVSETDRGRNVFIRPIAGTRRRGVNRDEDARLEAELRTCPKEIAEHLMLVDLARNDVARIAKPGTREVSELLAIARYSHVMHLTSEVVGELDDDIDALAVFRVAMNPGTLVGAPRLRAAELLREIEVDKRGPYGGAVGWFSITGSMDFAIVIRSAWVHDDVAVIRAGAGIVRDSVPAMEADETRKKAASVLEAIRRATFSEVTS
ncbi:MAG: anthranilate synthase component 1 [Deltaproteobacteria bacterium]|nr:anthranilate synthase component 1 [Deltaproteobacteria bacterium]